MLRFRYQRYVNFRDERYVSFRMLCYVFVANVVMGFCQKRFVTCSSNVFNILFIPDYILSIRNRQNLLIVESPQMNPSRHHLWLKTLKKTGSSLNNGASVLVDHHKLLLRCPST